MATSAIAAVDAASPSNPSSRSPGFSATAAKAESAENHRPIGMDHPPTRSPSWVWVVSRRDQRQPRAVRDRDRALRREFLPRGQPASFRLREVRRRREPDRRTRAAAAVAPAHASAKPVNANAHAHPAGTTPLHPSSAFPPDPPRETRDRPLERADGRRRRARGPRALATAETRNDTPNHRNGLPARGERAKEGPRRRDGAHRPSSGASAWHHSASASDDAESRRRGYRGCGYRRSRSRRIASASDRVAFRRRGRGPSRGRVEPETSRRGRARTTRRRRFPGVVLWW